MDKRLEPAPDGKLDLEGITGKYHSIFTLR